MARFLIAFGLALGFASVAYADRDVVIASCKAELGLSNSGCNCIAEKYDGMESREQGMFIAMIKQDRPAMQKLQGEFTINELQALGNKMEKMPAECASQ